ncbi:MAG: hypothetical protein H6992_07080 [Pseudomonadales bacterium]|nr:hypothetical protein [Pseudomonadales bacterium]
MQYLAEAKYGDELSVELAMENLAEKSFELVYRMSNLSRNRELDQEFLCGVGARLMK